ncbi:hypothetical protein ABZ297_11195 [Nonomuraea sp. NPDC005983]|uniref:hypothetical protein n=1 Tax=unclassified Nonomuraea TaxID=2593643 RepID=UPI00331B1DEB
MSEMDTRGNDSTILEGERERPIEAPEVDAAEQYSQMREEAGRLSEELPLEVNPADAAEQDRLVGQDDDDDYR